ncbi:hypothetical protein DACRYDRAFT_20341 [Dacryopinax primogenitus]|uniref:Macrofage activating glyco protein n=1 Tax=Dacryopinax primogenitus (strain DJM 731) TaxID=1858805 RepID=M5G940_DACPD|nr:uncharacterized protein DACRYDRAFT_20341 [Dacryopinax primogenitus]EJU04690.1 hypothetical protein DACRYDRAFT_20341 [Dacryopinax primogenitus]
MLALLLLAGSATAQYSATYIPADAPDQSQVGQIGTNQCGTTNSQGSLCQNAYLNGLDDFCLFAPPWTNGTNSTIGATEEDEVSWCMRTGYGTRTIPDGTITGAHWVQTPLYVQITGFGDLTKLNIPAGDGGGELDPHSWTGLGNPQGGLVFGTTFGGIQQYHEWTNFMSADEFCFRACVDGPEATTYCQHVYDEQGCEWNMPANYDIGTFTSCQADDGAPMGVYGSSTWDSNCQHTACAGGTPSAQAAPSSSMCSSVNSISNLAAVAPTATATGPFTFDSAALASSNSVASTAVTTSTTSSSSTSSGLATSKSSSTGGSGTATVSAQGSPTVSPGSTARGSAVGLELPFGSVLALGGMVLGMLML